MKYFLISILSLFLGCKKLNDRKEPATDFVVEKPLVIIDKHPVLPKGALKADFFGTQDSIYAYVKHIDTVNETTRVQFEQKKLPEIIIPESIGAELQVIKLKNFKKDVLLVNAKLKDTNFNEYYLFVWNDSIWTQPVNRFAIHKSNMMDTLVPIINNQKDSTQLLRYYSVFNMDRKSEKKYSWKLMQESVPIEE
ncbi:hypothetical protein [Aequorivita lipolytica]|uniref:Lipoprotein n=1 Tax=Aequorivita lipolytica TaxID=153267 RepID=A0A5C6YTA4_9FLAO|nr:hypothetical protein [Aequorivita lipolytica]TXD70626.1 hypothetical protein ESV24_00600 [Aequorivita lipolytica]SRX49659.1 hypothetical protein AEQU2_00122 [Aequorivita lipolytica]